MAVALTVAEQEALVGELDFGDKGFAPLDENGTIVGPATKEQQSEPSMVVMRAAEGEPSVLTTQTGAPIMSEGNQPFHANVYEFEDEQEPPVVESVNPNTAEIGGADLTISVTGTGFTPDSVIVFNGGDESTTFVSPTEVTTIVKPSTASTPGEYPVEVRSPAGTSNEVLFTFTEQPPQRRRK